MAKLRELKGVRPGDTIVVGGKEYPITEVVEYTLGDFQWMGLCSYAETFEVAEGKVRCWDEVTLLNDVLPEDEAVVFNGERYKRTETGNAQATFRTAEGTEHGEVTYSVLDVESGNRLCVEETDGDIAVYFSNALIPLRDISVISVK